MTSLNALQNSMEVLGQYLAMFQTAVLWVSHHPYWAVAIALLSLTLLQALLSMTSQALRQMLLWLAQSPFLLLRWAVSQGMQSTRQVLMTDSRPTAEEQIDGVLQRLEALRQEQEALLQELKLLLMARPR